MPKFKQNNISINYKVYGTGQPIILLHGAIVDFNYNFVQTGWVESLTENGFQVIGIDFRGYGESDKSEDSSFYGTTNFSIDVVNLINHLKLENVCLIGYSMGTVIALDLLDKHPEYFSKAVLIATGNGLIGIPPFILANILPGLAKVFSYDSFPSHLPNHVSAYWSFLNEVGLDRKSMIAFSLANYTNLTADKAAEINIPILIISGENDLVLGQGEKVAETLPKGKYIEIEGANHFTLATERETHKTTIEFLIKNEN